MLSALPRLYADVYRGGYATTRLRKDMKEDEDGRDSSRSGYSSSTFTAASCGVLILSIGCIYPRLQQASPMTTTGSLFPASFAKLAGAVC